VNGEGAVEVDREEPGRDLAEVGVVVGEAAGVHLRDLPERAEQSEQDGEEERGSRAARDHAWNPECGEEYGEPWSPGVEGSGAGIGGQKEDASEGAALERGFAWSFLREVPCETEAIVEGD
jgi:hypothetical protein